MNELQQKAFDEISTTMTEIENEFGCVEYLSARMGNLRTDLDKLYDVLNEQN